MNIRLLSALAPIANAVAASLRQAGHEVDLRPDTVVDHALEYGPETSLADVTAVVELLKPLLPAVHASDRLTGADIELRLGDAKPFSTWEVKVLVDSEPLAERLRAGVASLGFRDDGSQIDEQEKNVVKYGGATPFARQVLRFLLAVEGIRATEQKEWSDEDDDVWINARDPAFEGKTAKERYAVEIHGDDYEQMFALEAQVRGLGFASVHVRSLDVDSESQRFRFDSGPLLKDPDAAAELQSAIAGWLSGLGVDEDRYPLQLTSVEKGHARIELPLGALRSETLRPYAGAYPDRWQVVLRTDDMVAAQAVIEHLTDNGFISPRLESLPPASLGFSLRWGAAKNHPSVTDLFRGLVEGVMADHRLAAGYALTITETLEDEDPRILVDLPLSVASRVPFADRLGEVARGFELSIKTPNPDELRPLLRPLEALPWKSWEIEAESDFEPEIQYGGAPVPLVEHIQSLIEKATGIRLPLSKDWGDGDDDIWVHLPPPTVTASIDEDGPLDLDEWLARDLGNEPARPLVDVGAARVRIGPVTLARRTDHGDRQLIPHPELFAHYCLDSRTAQTLVHLAESVHLREPCLLEGETSVSKTSIILYLAMVLDQPVVRLNLNGQTDTGELVGRYVPQDVASALPVTPAELFAASELLESESRMILQRAATEGRTLNRVEVQQIMANERMPVHPWRWQDGLVVTAMRRGWWVVLDELNLAEPQILERLNPVLEPHASIVLTEHDNSVIGPGGDPVHPAFRIFATMNPAEYAGRSALSPAYRDRWRGYRYVVPPTEAEYIAMLRLLVHGEQPDVVLAGAPYLGRQDDAPLATLADVPGIDDFLRAVARFHAALEEAVGRKPGGKSPQLGARRRDRYVFTRRGLLAVMEFLASGLAGSDAVYAMRKALARYYLGRVQPGPDQRIVARLLDAAGIGPGTWAPDQLDALAAAPADEDLVEEEERIEWDEDALSALLDDTEEE